MAQVFKGKKTPAFVVLTHADTLPTPLNEARAVALCKRLREYVASGRGERRRAVSKFALLAGAGRRCASLRG